MSPEDLGNTVVAYSVKLDLVTHQAKIVLRALPPQGYLGAWQGHKPDLREYTLSPETPAETNVLLQLLMSGKPVRVGGGQDTPVSLEVRVGPQPEGGEVEQGSSPAKRISPTLKRRKPIR
jgi:hypothetical protein